MKVAIIVFQLASVYFNTEPPGNESVVFAPGVVSIDTVAEFGSTFSKDLKEFFFAIERKNGKAETWYRRSVANIFSPPIPLLVHDTYSFNDPMLSPGQDRLYFISDMPLNGTGSKKDFDIWYIERTKDGWSKPVNAGPGINSPENEYYVSFTSSGTMYFSSGRNAGNHDIYRAKGDGKKFSQAEKLSKAINSEHYEGDVFIAPDESYMIVACDRPGDSFGGGDLFISFSDKTGNWTPLKNMGPNVNGPRFDYCPFVTPDGKYLLYTRAENIRWVSADIINQSR
jgi:hypothetical protein